jgi:hypothetical protein
VNHGKSSMNAKQTPAAGDTNSVWPLATPARMAARIVESVDVRPAPLRIVLRSQALDSTLKTLRRRIASFEAQAGLAASTDFPDGD